MTAQASVFQLIRIIVSEAPARPTPLHGKGCQMQGRVTTQPPSERH